MSATFVIEVMYQFYSVDNQNKISVKNDLCSSFLSISCHAFKVKAIRVFNQASIKVFWPVTRSLRGETARIAIGNLRRRLSRPTVDLVLSGDEHHLSKCVGSGDYIE